MSRNFDAAATLPAPSDGGPRSIAQKALRSFAFRSGPIIYRRLLRILPAPRIRPKPLLRIPLLMMCGRSHLAMLEQALYSIAKNWSQLPELTVVSDGTVSLAEITARVSWWPASVKVESWEASRDYHRHRGLAELVAYAERHPFGRKLSAILAAATQRRILWIDCDILFYSDFTHLIPCEPEGKTCVLTTMDWLYGYDPHLLEILPHLLTKPPVNTGVAVYEGDIYEMCNLAPLVERTSTHCDNFTEQTILAEAVFRLGRIVWGLDVIRIFDGDKYSLRPSFTGLNWIARHYVTNVRHLFWRDALALRMGWSRRAPRRPSR
jgi:hypothetical protein